MHFRLTHWGRVTHICVGKLIIIGSDNDLSPDRRQAIIWANAALLLSIGSLRTYFSENLIKMQQFSLTKIHVKMSSAKWRPSCFGLNVLRCCLCPILWGWFWRTSLCTIQATKNVFTIFGGLLKIRVNFKLLHRWHMDICMSFFCGLHTIMLEIDFKQNESIMENFYILWRQKILVAQRTTWVDFQVARTIYGSPQATCYFTHCIIGSDNGLSPGRHQAIIWTSAGILLIWPLGTNFNEILIAIHTSLFNKMHLNMSSGKWRAFCLGLVC